jgi:threonine dehydrogenase-like Zn-dependent dehydrogenase
LGGWPLHGERTLADILQGPTIYPCVVGHEVVGEAVRVGKYVKHIKVGDRVGVVHSPTRAEIELRYEMTANLDGRTIAGIRVDAILERK